MSGGAVRTSLVALVVVLGCTVCFGTVCSGVQGAETAAPNISLCDELSVYEEKQADQPSNEIRDKMEETQWRKKKDGGVGGQLSSRKGETESGKPKIEDNLRFRKEVASRPSRHSEDWKSRQTDRFHDQDEEDMWEVDDEDDYFKVADESEEEVNEPVEESEVYEDSEEDEEDEETDQRLAEDDRNKNDQAQKENEQPVEPNKAQHENEEKLVEELKGRTKKEDGKAKPTKSKTKSKRKADKIPISEWSPNFPEFFAPTANDEVQNEECKKQSRIYVQHLRRMRTWALEMYDATAKLPSGILSGNVNQLGDFDECLGVDVHLRARGLTATADPEQQLEDDGTSIVGVVGSRQRRIPEGEEFVKAARGGSGSEVVHIRGRYCLASVDVDVLPDPRRTKADHAALHDAVQKALSYTFIRGSINDTEHFVPRFSTVSWGLCVPAVCSSQDVKDGLTASIRNWELGNKSWGSGKVRFQLDIPDEACRVAPQLPAHKRLPQSFFFFMGGLVLLVLITLIATLKDQGEADEDMALKGRLFMAFSLRRSWAVLTAPRDDGPSDIHCMHGLRAVCSLTIYVAHRMVPAVVSTPYSNRVKLTEATLSPMSMFLRSGILYTDTFLLLSGALSSLNFSREFSRTGSLAWRNRYVARIIRLTPPLLAVLLFYSFAMEHIGNGPRWGPFVESNARLCRNSMWRNLLYVQNFFISAEMCAPHTHQLALDFQLSLLSAPLVWLLNYSPIFASSVILVLQAASAWLRYQTTLQHRIALFLYHGAKTTDLYRTGDLSYAQSSHRATGYLVGIALGYALHKIKKPLKLSKLWVTIGWITSAALAGWAIFWLRDAATKDFKYDVHQAATFNVFAPLAWSVAISWVIMACHADLGGIMERILSSRVLLLLSRISYAFYLTQFLVFFHNMGSARSQTEFSVLGMIDLSELMTVLAVSTILTLMIDLPAQAIRNAFRHKAVPKPKNHTQKQGSKTLDGNNGLTWGKKEE